MFWWSLDSDGGRAKNKTEVVNDEVVNDEVVNDASSTNFFIFHFFPSIVFIFLLSPSLLPPRPALSKSFSNRKSLALNGTLHRTADCIFLSPLLSDAASASQWQWCFLHFRGICFLFAHGFFHFLWLSLKPFARNIRQLVLLLWWQKKCSCYCKRRRSRRGRRRRRRK